jgi:hypothetical protein
VTQRVGPEFKSRYRKKKGRKKRRERKKRKKSEHGGAHLLSPFLGD